MESLTNKLSKTYPGLTLLTLSQRQLFLFTSCLMEFLLFLNIFWSCVSTFPCYRFLPTISYLACYRGHDRLFAFTMTYWGVVLFSFNIFSYLHFHSNSKLFNFVIGFAGLGVSGLQLCIGVMDEGNTSYYARIERIHEGLMIGLVLSTLLWLYLTLLSNKLSKRLRYYIKTLIVMCSWTLLQWFYAEKDAAWFNYTTEALTEWVTVSLSVFCPYMYACEFKDLKLKISKRKY